MLRRMPSVPLVSKHYRRTVVSSTFYQKTCRLLFQCYGLLPCMLGEWLRMWCIAPRTRTQAVIYRATASIDMAGVCEWMQCNLATQTFYTRATQHGTEPRNM